MIDAKDRKAERERQLDAEVKDAQDRLVEITAVEHLAKIGGAG